MNGYSVVWHSLMLYRCVGSHPPPFHDIHTIFCGIPSTISNGRIFLLKFSNLVLELIYHLPWVLRCKVGGCLLTCPVYDLLSVQWHTGILLWVGFLLILSLAFSRVCRYLQVGRFADYHTIEYRIPWNQRKKWHGFAPSTSPLRTCLHWTFFFFFMSSHFSVLFTIVGIMF